LHDEQDGLFAEWESLEEERDQPKGYDVDHVEDG